MMGVLFNTHRIGLMSSLIFFIILILFIVDENEDMNKN